MREIFLLFLLGARDVATKCPDINFGLDTGPSIIIFLYENGDLATADQTMAISKAEVESKMSEQSIQELLIFVKILRSFLSPMSRITSALSS